MSDVTGIVFEDGIPGFPDRVYQKRHLDSRRHSYRSGEEHDAEWIDRWRYIFWAKRGLFFRRGAVCGTCQKGTFLPSLKIVEWKKTDLKACYDCDRHGLHSVRYRSAFNVTTCNRCYIKRARAYLTEEKIWEAEDNLITSLESLTRKFKRCVRAPLRDQGKLVEKLFPVEGGDLSQLTRSIEGYKTESVKL